MPALRPLAALVAGLALILSASPAAAEKPDAELRKQKAEVSARRARAAAQLDALRAEDREVESALEALGANVVSQRRALLSAESAAQRARSEADRAKAAEADARGRYEAARVAVLGTAVRTYMVGGVSVVKVGGRNPDELVRAKAYQGMATGLSADALDQLHAASKDLSRLASQRASAASRAERLLLESQRRLASLNTALAQQQGFSDQVEARIEARLAEAQSLEAMDKQLSDEILRRQAELAKRVAARPAPPRSGGGGGGGRPVSIVGEGEIVSVRGIRVHRSIANNLAGLLSAGDAAGLTLSGGGWRSSESQIALRRAHCGSSHYDIYEKPASQCRPPTARPGQSMHERGLAVDFTCNGALIQSRSNPCFRFLQANGPRFGFHNLPSEPWHWSTNGQ